MVWLIVVVSTIVVTVIVYFLFPIFKRISKNRKTEGHIKSSEEERREERKKIKEQNKMEKQAEKEALVIRGDSNVRTVEDGEDIFAKEDPDTKVNYENFDLGGLFSENQDGNINDFSNENKPDESINTNYEEMFDKYFSDDKPFNSTQYRTFNDTFKNDPFEMSSDGNIDGNEADIENILKSHNLLPGSGLEDSEIKEIIDGMSSEMKALILSNFLDKKNY